MSAGQIQVAWKGRDADGDVLTYYLRYSRDGVHYSPLASGIAATEWDVDVSALPAFEDGQGFFEVLASDGLNTTVAHSALLYGSGAVWAQGSNPPWVEIFTPDSGHDYFEGATVILHSSGWDLEDRALSRGLREQGATELVRVLLRFGGQFVASMARWQSIRSSRSPVSTKASTQ